MKTGISALRMPNATDLLDYQQLIETVSKFLKAAEACLPQLDTQWVHGYAGGLYCADCAEDKRIQENWSPPVREFLLFGQIEISAGKDLELASPAHRLYYDIYKRYSAVEFFDLRLSGSGRAIVEIILDDGYGASVLKEIFVTLSKKGEVIESISPNILPANGSLFIRITAMQEAVTLTSARWLTRTRRDLVKTGLRVVVIRTFGNRGAVSASLQKSLTRLRQVDEAVALRHVFMIYDCSSDRTTQPILSTDINASILDVKGPNLGGGGNASMLSSLLIEACDTVDIPVEEVVICDDDALYDAESLLRNDAFVLSRTKPCISTAIVCSQRNPEIVQEAGGTWGRFFDRSAFTVTIDHKDSPRLLFPYLVRATRNLSDRHNWSYMGSFQEIDFSTFIFISVPFSIIRSQGGPRPFFLRNDDVDLCLRARASGAPTIVNPGIRVWHHTAHNASSEFFSTLHGLIINNSDGRWFSNILSNTLVRSISSLASVGNLPLLAATEAALRVYDQGPSWMCAADYPGGYLAEMSKISAISARHGSQLPFEVVDVLKTKGGVQVINLLERYPRKETNAQVIFANGADGSFWSYMSNEADDECWRLMVSALGFFTRIVQNSKALGQAWSDFMDRAPVDFWRERFASGKAEFTLAQLSLLDLTVPVSNGIPVILEKGGVDWTVKNSNINSDIDSNISYKLPASFNPQRYLSINPDVRAAGMDPVKHYIEYGRFEGREF